MLDEYVYGQVDRISPEAPVPVLTISNKKYCLGGAANVALNIHALQAKVFLFGISYRPISLSFIILNK